VVIAAYKAASTVGGSIESVLPELVRTSRCSSSTPARQTTPPAVPSDAAEDARRCGVYARRTMGPSD